MRIAWGAFVLMIANCSAAPAPLRFAVADSWAMPLVQIENDQPTQGILYDLMTSLAQQVGVPAEFHVLARARVQSAMEHGDIDVRCYAAQSWLANRSGDYIWSIPLLVHRDVLISNANHPQQINLRNLPRQPVGTVLSYTYPTLQPLFDTGKLIRDDARNQEQVLKKLSAGRYQYAVSNQWSLDWFNQKLMPQHQLRVVAMLQEQSVGCLVRNDPALPVQRILRTLLRMKISGEIDGIIGLYTGNGEQLDKPVTQPPVLLPEAP
ncbi:amino acid ABC transporter substrate-binding protein [Pseudomonas agarici]|uniref:Amino acid ABC transporter substrate-binding protein n=1 Tax=Pseudomonas agarici TaxID=46677 RepID=A0A0X1T749_PSEAA|nr:transporter substrate-binding domain-containing protein [Pseudomonas agarici]AMB87937.1 amino acid ABC transporter substrate-binding protein [Pseudomonas agarici]NWB92810.1 transporter substrate-binding domain-containing protein [Pseudomonas agarici]NWC09077.1 transporter substrate-binding domain-containing protein [Pseudomonas agarici]SEK35286.1 amino acid ABC transporter substrate-binding protein, PAAT family [Pseudomonas agarici]